MKMYYTCKSSVIAEEFWKKLSLNIDKITITVENENLFIRIRQIHHHFLEILYHQDSDATIKIYKTSIEQSSSSQEVLPEPTMKEFNLVVVKKNEFESLDGIVDNNFGIFERSRIRSKEKHSEQRLRAKLAARANSKKGKCAINLWMKLRYFTDLTWI